MHKNSVKSDRKNFEPPAPSILTHIWPGLVSWPTWPTQSPPAQHVVKWQKRFSEWSPIKKSTNYPLKIMAHCPIFMFYEKIASLPKNENKSLYKIEFSHFSQNGHDVIGWFKDHDFSLPMNLQTFISASLSRVHSKNEFPHLNQ